MCAGTQVSTQFAGQVPAAFRETKSLMLSTVQGLTIPTLYSYAIQQQWSWLLHLQQDSSSWISVGTEVLPQTATPMDLRKRSADAAKGGFDCWRWQL
jgi:hypothetical protein